jgi:hypothetical protein
MVLFCFVLFLYQELKTANTMMTESALNPKQ